VRSGNIPGSRNLYYKELLNSDGSLKTPEELRRILADQKITWDDSTEVLTTCGSGVTACTIMAALKTLEKTDHVYLYDGGWADYGQTSEGAKAVTKGDIN
jgi:thiosulfate/3-mercaptopyruvate sulfurtransferase